MSIAIKEDLSLRYPIYYLSLYTDIPTIIQRVKDTYPSTDRHHHTLNREVTNSQYTLSYIWPAKDTYNFAEYFHLSQDTAQLKKALLENQSYIPTIKDPVVYISKHKSIAQDCMYLKHKGYTDNDILSFTNFFLRAEITEFKDYHTSIPQMTSDYRDYNNNLYFLTLSDYIPIDKGDLSHGYYAIESTDFRHVNLYKLPMYKKYYRYSDIALSYLNPFYQIDPYVVPEYAGIKD